MLKSEKEQKLKEKTKGKTLEEYLNVNYKLENISNIELTKRTVKVKDIQVVKEILRENYNIKFLSSEEREIFFFTNFI